MSPTPGGALQLAYDAARKAATSLLAAQGLRPTTSGGHVAVQDAVMAQFGGSFDRFSRMRRRRHQQEYPGPESPATTQGDADELIEFGAEVIADANRLFDEGPPNGPLPRARGLAQSE